ncbi:uncharacterized protein ACLA_082530 [Aspergillus clavatus NRRL 1]|uniref:Uncharacterized protein n=1 Tax=Aspergillus clavatus (strain ATCC 1007 / CBS 513.65 / DSM 816 / NCTC 3887 / NRRL 1 / QM 1276 / 107) TaxID=344612 RepID=A1CTC5_ASPCL|nr:uncharacterized protein ACLA_082530 [Aspergillus clavatus NRRL 1]EAW06562.1 conserved hypothetical protein [Aspergillus clavatus NRRL 1]
MAYRQQGLSRTLPKDFTFYSASAEEPRTPERTSIHVDGPPPPPHHSSCRLRRLRVRSGTDLFAQAQYDLTTFDFHPSDIPLPSIEIPSSREAPLAQSFPESLMRDDRFLAPPRNRMALKTPPAQIRGSPFDEPSAWSSWDHQTIGETIQRPGSAWSQASDSSVSSIETFASRRSLGGSCTSAESDHHDPFFYLEIPPKQALEQTPRMTVNDGKKPRNVSRKDRWTLDMDNHLWNTYQLYIQAPTITPFKMTPGSIPPLGVTHRVAREAKKSWDKKRYRLTRPFQSSLHQPQQLRSGESTPTPRTESPKAAWPKSEASTRRRLKLLCKRKFSIAPHYQRLMQSRSPTPPLDLFSHHSNEVPQIESPGGSSTTYATRDLGVSLVASSVPGPLSQLAMEHASPPTTTREWTQSVHYEPQSHRAEPLARTHVHLEDPASVPRLGSPFTYHTWGPNVSKKSVHWHTPRARRETIHVTGSRLRPPPQVEALSATNDTPIIQIAQQSSELSDEQETQRHLESLVRDGKLTDIGHRRVRIRSRGATTSAITPQNLDQLFSPPSSASRNEETASVEKSAPNPLLNLSGENIKRLGSPFKVDGASKRPESRRFIRHAPSLSDPFASGPLPRARPVNRDVSSKDQQDMRGALPYDPTERGISDAERIRRQILNMSYSRQ